MENQNIIREPSPQASQPSQSDGQQGSQQAGPDKLQAFEQLSEREKRLYKKETAIKQMQEALGGDDEIESYLRWRDEQAQNQQRYNEGYEDDGYEEGYEEEEYDPRAGMSIEEIKADILRELEEREQQKIMSIEQQEEMIRQEGEALEELKTELTSLKEQFPLTTSEEFPENIKAVWDIISSEYSRTGKIMPVQDAARMVEDYLDQQLEKWVKMDSYKNKLRKYGFIFKGGEISAPRNESPTITNRGFTTNIPSNNDKLISREESLKRAASLLSQRNR